MASNTRNCMPVCLEKESNRVVSIIYTYIYVHLMRNSRYVDRVCVDCNERRRLTVRQSDAHTVPIILTAPFFFH